MRAVLITGAEGLVGTVLRQGLAGRLSLQYLTRTPQPYPSIVADIRDLDALVPAFRGIDTVIHLAGTVDLKATWEEVLPHNIVGTRTVFEAARLAGVKSVIYASSGHVLSGEEEAAGRSLYDLGDRRVFDHLTPPCPDTPYALSKLCGENIGRYYAEAHGLHVICVRVGMVLADDDPCSDSPGKGRSAGLSLAERYPRIRAKWLSHRDCCQLFLRCLEADTVPWAVVFGTSNNPRQIWSLAETRRVLNYAPQDAAPESPRAP
jgi:nucleoside-diphosphate-sugar epimerase